MLKFAFNKAKYEAHSSNVFIFARWNQDQNFIYWEYICSAVYVVLILDEKQRVSVIKKTSYILANESPNLIIFEFEWSRTQSQKK